MKATKFAAVQMLVISLVLTACSQKPVQTLQPVKQLAPVPASAMEKPKLNLLSRAEKIIGFSNSDMTGKETEK